MSKSTGGGSSQELDFEDIVAQFESSLHRPTGDARRPVTGVQQLKQTKGYNINMDMGDLEPDLQALCEALMEQVQTGSQFSRTTFCKDDGIVQGHVDSSILKEVFRAEIKATLTHVQTFRETKLDGSASITSSERSTMNSLRRRVRDRDQKLQVLKQKLKEAQIVKYRLEHSVSGYQATNDEYEDANELLENEVRELRKQNAALIKRVSDADVKHRKDHHERERLNATLAKFRQEVVVAHQAALNARTEAKQAKKRMQHLEARAAETKASSAAVSLRIGELKEIQEEIIATIKRAQNSGDTTAARRIVENLGEKRSRLVGKIANLLIRNKSQDENSPKAEKGAQASNTPGTSGERTFGTPDGSDYPGQRNHSPAAQSNSQDSGGDEPNRKQRFESLRKFGNELTRMTTGRNSRRVVMANMEKTCEAVERDTDALREVIEMKENELERMENELAEATERAATLEMALQKERQKKRLENRNMRNLTMEQALTEMRTFTTARKKKSTLFDWQSQGVKSSGKERKTAKETTVSNEEASIEKKSWAM